MWFLFRGVHDLVGQIRKDLGLLVYAMGTIKVNTIVEEGVKRVKNFKHRIALSLHVWNHHLIAYLEDEISGNYQRVDYPYFNPSIQVSLTVALPLWHVTKMTTAVSSAHDDTRLSISFHVSSSLQKLHVHSFTFYFINAKSKFSSVTRNEMNALVPQPPTPTNHGHIHNHRNHPPPNQRSRIMDRNRSGYNQQHSSSMGRSQMPTEASSHGRFGNVRARITAVQKIQTDCSFGALLWEFHGEKRSGGEGW